ncbi:MAG: magnesium and cobalt exporter, family [Thermomicrobiales bacterium]|nr:magnesium and cobalt exporter, family [Thermomicrobiales bacterium]
MTAPTVPLGQTRLTVIPRASLPTPRFEVRPGAFVVGPDGTHGRVRYVVVSPGSGEVQVLVVRTGTLRHRDVVVPVEAVNEADEEIVRVRLTGSQFERLPTYREEEFVKAPSGWRTPTGRKQTGALFRLPLPNAARGLQPGQHGQTDAALGGRPLAAGQTVICRDGEVGRLDLVLLDPATQRATHFVVRRGVLLHRDTVVPVDWIREINRDRVLLDVDREQLERLPEYRPDDEITADVADVLWNGKSLNPDDVEHVTIRTSDGVVELRGITTTEEARAVIESVVRRVPGVVDVRNRLQSLEALAAVAVRHPGDTPAGANASSAGQEEATMVQEPNSEWVVRALRPDPYQQVIDPVSGIGYGYGWLHDLLNRATGLDVDRPQAEEIARSAEKKLTDLFDVAIDTAAANGRGLILRHDLPLTKGMRRSLEDAAELTKDDEFDAETILVFLTHSGFRARVDEMVRADLPRLMAALLILGGRVISVLEPASMPPLERWELLTRREPDRPTPWELDRASRVLDLTL